MIDQRFNKYRSFIQLSTEIGENLNIVQGARGNTSFKDEYFDYVVTSEEAGCDKPNARPFKIALEKLNISADKIWMIVMPIWPAPI
jgi:histidinol phosphatase-like enzyme